MTPVGMADIQSRMASFRSMTTSAVSGGRLGGATQSSSSSSSSGAVATDSFAAALSAADTSTSGSVGAAAGADTVSNVPYADAFNAAGQRYGISPQLLAAVAKVESSYRPDVISPAGAQGLMQLMPSNAAAMGVNAFDPTSAIDGAARMLTGLTQRFGSVDLALGAYNVGSGTISRAGGITSGSQAEHYVNLVKKALGAIA